MYIAIYISAIVVFVGIALWVFWAKQKKDKKRLAGLKDGFPMQPLEDGLPLTEEKQSQENVLVSKNEKEFADAKKEHSHAKKEINLGENVQENVPKNSHVGAEEAQFEDFSLDAEEKQSQTKNKFATIGGKKFDKLFDFDDEIDDFDDDFPKVNDDDKLSEDEMAKYEKSLRDSLKFDMDEEFEKFNRRKMPSFENSSPFSGMGDFDVEKLRGKSEAEIMDMIKEFPPKAQEIILTDILARKSWED